MNPFISVPSLQEFISNHENKEELKEILNKLCENESSEEICLTTVAEEVNEGFNKQYEKGYPYTDSSINSVYNLLDIDQKGSISREDVDSFLIQIQEAEVQNFD